MVHIDAHGDKARVLHAGLLEKASELSCTLREMCSYGNGVPLALLMNKDGGKWWSKEHHLVVVKIVKNVAFFFKNVKKMVKEIYKNF